MKSDQPFSMCDLLLDAHISSLTGVLLAKRKLALAFSLLKVLMATVHNRYGSPEIVPGNLEKFLQNNQALS